MAENKNNKLAQFLKKTYELVEDPDTNDLISWNYSNETFIIWDHVKFASHLLPQHFRHDNFSSFVYQLNNYGFRKVNNDPCEYYNEWFQPWKKDLLYNIKKRSQDPQREKSKVDIKKLKTGYEMLKETYEKLKIEINELRQEQKSIEKPLLCANFEEGNEEEIVTSIIKGLSNPSFVQQVSKHLYGDKIKESDERATKKLKASVDTDKVQFSFMLNDLDSAEKSSGNRWNIEELATILPNLSSGNCLASEKMLLDDFTIRKVSEEERESNFMLQSKDLIAEPSNLPCDKTSIGEKEDEGERRCDSMMVLAVAAGLQEVFEN